MKFYLNIAIFVLVVLIAIGVYIYYLVRYRLYNDMVFICKSLKNDITFNKNDIESILSKCRDNISFTTYFLISKNSQGVRLFSKKDANLVTEFVTSLGRGDVNFEVNNINYYENIFASSLACSKDELSKKGLTYFKLIVAIGLIICIVLI